MRILLAISLLFLSGLCQGQQPSYFKIGEKAFEGVDIYDVIQDLNYNYWFATDQGIFKHDGYSYEKIECEEMSGGSVFNFVINTKGIIYCRNLNQQVFQIKNDICNLVYTIPDAGNDIDLSITSEDNLLISSSRNLYVLNTANHLIFSTNFGTSKYFTRPFKLNNGKGTIIYESGSNLVWVYKDGKLNSKKFSGSVADNQHPFDVLQFYRIGNASYSVCFDKRVYELDEDSLSLKFICDLNWNPLSEKIRLYGIDNNLWIASNISGLVKLTNRIRPVTGDKKIFSDYFISYVYKDREGNILLCTFDEGVLVIPNLKVNDVEETFAPYFFTKLYAQDDVVYLGTREGQLFSYDSEVHKLTSAGSKGIEELTKWPGRPFLLSDNGGLSILDLESKTQKTYDIGSCKDVAYLGDNTLFLALNIGLHESRYNPITKELTFIAKHFVGRTYEVERENNSGYIYVSTSEGLKYLDSRRTIKEITLNQRAIHATSLYANGDKMYIATRKNGVLILQKGKIIHRFYPKHNEQNLTILKMLIHKDKIYANTQLGLVILNFKGKVIYYLNKSSGLSTNKIIDFCISNKQLWIAHSRGVQRFNLSDITAKVDVPKLFLSGVLVNDTLRTTPHKIGFFNYDQRKFRFVLQVPTLKHRENIRYHYKLEGNNDQWLINNYQENEVVYNALGPGTYRFVVKAENNGVFSKPIYYSFSISAPFYQRWWFITLIVLICLLIVTLIYIRQLKIQQKKAQQINELNASRLTAIQSQMNPHFIFNSLNSIQDLVLKGDVDNSYTFITKFSNLVRRTLNYSDKDYIEFEQEIKLLELYLSLEKLRFKEDLVFTIDTEDIEDIFIPPMLVQPFIENALVHGLLHKEGLKKLSIHFHLEDTLICTITDNGIGRQKAREIKERQRSNHESFAINAIKKRFEILENHFNGSLGYSYEDLIEHGTPSGTRVTLKIPFKHKF